MYRHIDFFFKDPATTEIYPLSPHDALPITSRVGIAGAATRQGLRVAGAPRDPQPASAVREARPGRPTARQSRKIGRAHVRNPVTLKSPFPSSPYKQHYTIFTIAIPFPLPSL